MLWFGVPSCLVRLRRGWPGLLQLPFDCCVALRSYCGTRGGAEEVIVARAEERQSAARVLDGGASSLAMYLTSGMPRDYEAGVDGRRRTASKWESEGLIVWWVLWTVRTWRSAVCLASSCTRCD